MRRAAILLPQLLIVVVSVLLAGCDVGYLSRAGYEEVRILWRRQPITQVLDRPDLAPDVRARLETVLAVRKFDEEHLGEKVGGAYETISQVDQGAIVWVLMAAWRDSLTPYTWWVPIVGNVPYRGYFHKSDAEAAAAKLEAAGYDTYVRPAVAFSSLGFFNDPLLSNLLALDRVELAGVITHELFHRTYFLASDIMFDESAATWVGSRGAWEFFARTEGPESADALAARGVYESDLKFSRFLQNEEARLLKLYAAKLPPAEVLRQRAALFRSISEDYARLKPSLSGLERFDLDQQPLNNAVLLNYLIYFHDSENFAALEAQHQGDVRATIRAIIDLAKANPNDPFFALWQATQGTRTADVKR